MATTDKFLGTQVSVYLNNKKVFNALSKDFSLDTDMVDVTDDDTGGFKAFLAADHGGKMTVEGHFEQQASVTSSYVSPEDIMDIQINRTLCSVYMSTGSQGDVKLVSSCYISSFKFTAPHGDKVTFTADLQLTGTITVASQS